MKLKKLIMTKGLPASGKSTWAKQQVDEFGFKRINKDDLRAMIDNSKHTKGNEKMIIAIETAMIKEFALAKHNIIVDNTHFVKVHEDRLRSLAEALGYQFEIKDFSHVSLEECIERDKKRPNYVGESVIRRMYNEHLREKPTPIEKIKHNPDLPNCIIVDIDGTIADNEGIRGPFDFEKVYEDNVKHEVLSVINSFCQTYEPIAFIFSGRENVGNCNELTRKWLVDKVFPNYNAFSYSSILALREDIPAITMRKEKDHRKDSIIKKEMYDTIVKDKYNVLAVFDDRNQVVEMWRSLGLQTFQVANGDF